MKKQIMFIHSAGPQGIHQGSSGLIAHLQEQLGEAYHVISPGMPENLDCALWKAQIASEIEELDEELFLIGHSLGGSVLLKYLSEEGCKRTISGLFLVAAPYWGKDDDWQHEEYTLSNSFAAKLPHISKLILYHSRHDPIVPFAHAQHYAKQLPQAVTRAYEGDDHYFGKGLPELADDIKRM
ncbi:alpha/beta hydrolase [Paenibacillus sp. p3-SID867]|uniref:RBBP9/YdeN family alpha/beta hydrolase n=1 Tax=Paenibacillus sp. p3-SID867 TaxID=2916363 RepID=UPI0021A8E53A|nr:alpha/beta hydrolase [Paenibacillus sp. p3-SID867]MCT1400283.1 alpha/beta hydrolase [Paenibacillus sp. p3-SID867]